MLLALHKRLVETEGALEAALKQKEWEQVSQPLQPVINVEDAPPITVPSTEKAAEVSPAAPTTDVEHK